MNRMKGVDDQPETEVPGSAKSLARRLEQLLGENTAPGEWRVQASGEIIEVTVEGGERDEVGWGRLYTQIGTATLKGLTDAELTEAVKAKIEGILLLSEMSHRAYQDEERSRASDLVESPERPGIGDRISRIKRRFRYWWQRIELLQVAVLGMLVGTALALSVAGVLLRDQRLAALLLNMGTGLAGGAVTYVLLELILGRRQRKEALIAQMKSEVRDVAVAAAGSLAQAGWLTDGSLQRATLRHANLEGANLSFADLREANLMWANLARATLRYANLEGAFLAFSNLEEADLTGANLEGASLRAMGLRGIFDDPSEAPNMRRANLAGATGLDDKLHLAMSLAGATLPNGTRLSEDGWQTEFERWEKKQKGEELPAPETDDFFDDLEAWVKSPRGRDDDKPDSDDDVDDQVDDG